MVQFLITVHKMFKNGFLFKLVRLGWFLIWAGIIFQRRLVDTEKDLPPSESRLNREPDNVHLIMS